MSRSSVPPEGGDRIDAPSESVLEPTSRAKPDSKSKPVASTSRRTDYAGAIYGSILAASVVATAGSAEAPSRREIIVLLLVSGLVFWATHVYAHLAGERVVGQAWSWPEIRRSGAHEWAIVEAAVLPAAAVAVSWFGMSVNTGLWLALGVAVAQQVVWACLGAARAGASRGQIITEGFVNLALGLIIVAAKVILKE
ncbi:hypothetical protein AB0912_33355 [Streptomyces sp. NPDC007084]|uniref:hypothetical protein n=1 Tax=Streptomyces sp. NPDC007084 TaxID=3154313 RepID=UPI0034564FBA